MRRLALFCIRTKTTPSKLVRIGKKNASKAKDIIHKHFIDKISEAILPQMETGDSPFAVRNIKTDMPNIFNESTLLSIQTTLKTLDLMHVAAARYAKQNNHEIGAFVTGNMELLGMRSQLSRITGIPFLSLREYERGLGPK